MRVIICTIAIGLGACAIGYTSDERVMGVAAGDAALTNCTQVEEQTDCQSVRGGHVSKQFTDLFAGLTSAVRGLIFGPPD